MSEYKASEKRSLLRIVCVIMSAAAGTALVGLMCVTIADILGRNTSAFFVLGALEMSTLTLVLLGFFAFPYKFLVNGQIAVDLFTSRLDQKINFRLDSVWLIVTGLFFFVLAYPLLDNGLKVHVAGERSTNMEWSPLVYVIPAVIGCAATGLTCLALGIRGFFQKDIDQRTDSANIGL